ncbi:CHASE2 domain-containing protein, partial [uncultured Phenylobacterium sp.]|uniref:CHASE2 domain-containing protein n=1 Tax=uncultured Phenylobacterium sp. TaxID=349273 RepID=UPI0025FDB1BA
MRLPGRAAAGRAVLPAAAAAVVAGIIVLAAPGLLRVLDRAALDTFIRQTPPPAPSRDIAIVAIDEPSLAAHGQWPWPRDLVARLVTALADRGASVVAFDVIFPEQDRLGAPGVRPGDATSTDAAFAAAMTRVPVVTGFALTFETTASSAIPCASRTPPMIRQRTETMTSRLFAATGAICDIPEIASASASAGTINVSPDEDGMLRRLPAVTASAGLV